MSNFVTSTLSYHMFHLSYKTPLIFLYSVYVYINMIYNDLNANSKVAGRCDPGNDWEFIAHFIRPVVFAAIYWPNVTVLLTGLTLDQHIASTLGLHPTIQKRLFAQPGTNIIFTLPKTCARYVSNLNSQNLQNQSMVANIWLI